MDESMRARVTNTVCCCGVQVVFTRAEDLFTYVSACEGRPVLLYVYSAAAEDTRPVRITPHRGWDDG